MAELNKDELTERSQLVRTFEASCKIEYPTDPERNFRLALMKRLGERFGLREVRDKEIVGPGSTNRQRSA